MPVTTASVEKEFLTNKIDQIQTEKQVVGYELVNIMPIALCSPEQSSDLDFEIFGTENHKKIHVLLFPIIMCPFIFPSFFFF